MKKILFLIMALIASSPLATAKDKTVALCILETSDVHGSFFPYDFINRTPCKGSLARLSTYVKRERERFGDNLLLLDNGDILQGQPTVYYYNFIDTAATHVTAAMMNYLRYDAGNMGNHDMRSMTVGFANAISRFSAQTLSTRLRENRIFHPTRFSTATA